MLGATMTLQWLKSIFKTPAEVETLPDCPICKKPSMPQLVGAVPWTHHGPFHTENFTLLQCQKCDVVYLDPMPTQQDLTTLYQSSDQFKGDYYEGEERVGQVLAYLTSCLIDQKLMPKSGERMLEVGAGLSWMARACKAVDPQVMTFAQDVSAEASDRCKWVDQYFVSRVEDLPDFGLVSLISLTHVIEHLNDPAAMLKLLSKKLVVGGKIFITAPYRPSNWTVNGGIKPWLEYSYLHVPAHTAYLSKTFFTQQCPPLGLALVSFNSGHEANQVFEAVLERV